MISGGHKVHGWNQHITFSLKQQKADETKGPRDLLNPNSLCLSGQLSVSSFISLVLLWCCMVKVAMW